MEKSNRGHMTAPPARNRSFKNIVTILPLSSSNHIIRNHKPE
jgi:hypothetical protein